MKKILAALVLVLVLAGCASPIKSGYITEKDYTPGFWSGYFMCAGYNAQGVCTTQIWIPVYYDPTWNFDLENNGKTGWVYVTEEEFGQYEVGDFYPRG